MFNIVLTHLQKDIEIEKEYVPKNSTITNVYSPTEEELIKNLQDVDAVISAYEPFTEKVLNSLPRLKIISQAAIGYNNIDIEIAKKNGITVLNVPDYCVEEVASHTLTLILNLNREILKYSSDVNKGNWNYRLIKNIRRISTQTLGLYGFGRIGYEVYKRAKSFGFEVIVFDPFINESFKELDIKIVDIDEFLRESDYISIHTPLTESTKNFFDVEKFKLMKETSYIINTGRGGVIKEEDLLFALDNKLIRGAALDVLSDEYNGRLNKDLLNRKNLIITPHVAYYSLESEYEVRKRSAENIKMFLEGKFEKLNIV